jgi:hypothetical protein
MWEARGLPESLRFAPANDGFSDLRPRGYRQFGQFLHRRRTAYFDYFVLHAG